MADAGLVWTSDLDGELAAGTTSFTSESLSAGEHLVTLRTSETAPAGALPLAVTLRSLTGSGDEDLAPGAVAPDVALCVVSDPWGDLDGDGSVGSGDAVHMLRQAVVSLPVPDDSRVARFRVITCPTP